MQISIRGARTEKRMSQEVAARAMGVSKTTISNWENGITAPTAPQLMKLCALYGVSIADIFLTEELAKSEKTKRR